MPNYFQLFLVDVRQQVQLPVIRSYLKLYSTISTDKLATFLDMDEHTLRTYLLCFKHKTRNLVLYRGKWWISLIFLFRYGQAATHSMEDQPRPQMWISTLIRI